MKTSLMLALALGLTAVSTSYASEPAATKARDAKSVKVTPRFAAPKPSSGSKTPLTLTGSYLPREVRRGGTITDGPYNVAVIDADMIRNSGASDLQQLLVRRGFGH